MTKLFERLQKNLGEQNQWCFRLNDILNTEEYRKLMKKIQTDRKQFNVFPEAKNVLKPFRLTPWADVKVVILGQSPYADVHHKIGEQYYPYATGLSFGVPKNVGKIPNTLRNIINESNTKDVSLESWAEQGVLMLNTSLTSKQNHPDYYVKDWESFTEQIIISLSAYKPGLIFLLWGERVKKYKKHIHHTCHVLEASYPSDLDFHKGFLNCGHFKKVNEILKKTNGETIIW